MTRDEIKEIVIQSLQEFLASCNREVSLIDERTDPIDDLGLDTVDGVDWLCDISERGFNIPKDVNPFRIDKNATDGSFRHRTVGELVDLLQQYVINERKADND